MKSIFGSAPLLPCTTPHQRPRTHSNPNAFIETYSAALQGWAEGSAHYEHQRPRWALTWSFEMIGVSHSVNKKLGRLCAPLILSTRMEIQLPSDSGLAEGEECKDLKEMGHHFLPGCVCSWWVVDQTPTCCPCSRGPYCRKRELCCGPTMCHQRNVLLNTIANWLSIPTMTSMSIFMSCSVFQLWNVVPVYDNGQQWFNLDKHLKVLLFWRIIET